MSGWGKARAFFVRLPRRVLGIVIVSVAAVWSFDSLRNLGEYVGFGALAWMFPICVDAVAAYGMDVWMRREPAWKAGRVLALSAVLISIAGNVADWILHGTHPLAAFMAAVPPTAVAVMLGIMHRNSQAAEEARLAAMEAESERLREQADRERRRTRVQPKRVERTRTEPQVIESQTVTELSHDSRGEIESAAPSTEATPITRKQPRRTDEELIQDVRRLIDETGAEIGKRYVMRELRVGSDTALRLLRAVKGNDTESEAG